MNGTCPEYDRLLLFVEGELSADEADGVAEHVVGCSHCSEKVAELRLLTAELRRVGSEAARGVSGGRRTDVDPKQGEPCPGPGALTAYADGSASAESAEDVERHLARCPSCLREVADIRALAGAPDRDVSDATVERALARLEEASRTAVVRWKERSLELVRGFAAALADELAGPVEPAPALARSGSDEIRIEWNSGKTKLVGLVQRDDTVSLTGRVTIGRAPATSTSVALASASGVRGPETPDGDGRFGPWALSMGRNVLRLSGVPGESGGSVDLIIELEVDQAVR